MVTGTRAKRTVLPAGCAGGVDGAAGATARPAQRRAAARWPQGRRKRLTERGIHLGAVLVHRVEAGTRPWPPRGHRHEAHIE